MAREFAKNFYNSNNWKKVRKSFIKLRMGMDGGMCQECHERPGEIVHHRVWLTPDNIDDANVTLSYSNLEYVCHACHDKIHGNLSEISDKLVQYDFTPDGQLVVRETNAVRGAGKGPL